MFKLIFLILILINIISCGKKEDVINNTVYQIQGINFPLNLSQNCYGCPHSTGSWSLNWNVDMNNKISGSFIGIWGLLFVDGKVENNEYKIQARNINGLGDYLTQIDFNIVTYEMNNIGSNIDVDFEAYSYAILIESTSVVGIIKKIKE